MTWVALRRHLGAHRRLVAGLLAGLAVLLGISAVRPPPVASVAVLAAARDLVAGSPLVLADLRTVALPRSAVPEGALRPGAAVLGRLVAGPVRRGEPLTDVRVLGPALLAAFGRDVVAVPLRFADAGAVTLLRPGDRVDVLASPATALAAPGAPAGSVARVVAADVAVLVVAATDPVAPGAATVGDGALVVVACSPAVARALAAAGATERLSPALRAPNPPTPTPPAPTSLAPAPPAPSASGPPASGPPAPAPPARASPTPRGGAP
jgi:Flp pilus assembly protein CpaB